MRLHKNVKLLQYMKIHTCNEIMKEIAQKGYRCSVCAVIPPVASVLFSLGKNIL